MASPKGPARQLVPGALHDLSWPKASWDICRRGGRPGMVAWQDYELGCRDINQDVNLRESMAISCTVVMVFPSSGTLTLRLLANELVRCQNGTLSGRTAVSL